MSALSPLFAPSGIIVVGASRAPGKLGTAMTDAVSTARVPVALVNSRGGDGFQTDIADAARQIREVGGSADLLISCVPAAATADVVARAAESGIAAALVCAGGFAEIGGPGVQHQHDLESAASGHIRVLGPNTSGFFVPERGLRASFVPGVADLQAGAVAVVASSGGVNHMLSFRLAAAGVGVSVGVGIGAGFDVAHADVLEYLATHESTRAVVLHLESIDDGPTLLAAVRAVAARKPVIALVVGRRGDSAFAQSHTGALATSWRTTRSALAQAGAVLVEHEDELVAAAAALSRIRLAPTTTPGVGLITGQAGPGLLIDDHADAAGWSLPPLTDKTRDRIAALLPPLTFQANPVDTGRPGETFPEIVTAVGDDPAIDLVAVYALAEPVLDLPEAAASARTQTPILLGMDGGTDDLAAAQRDAAARGIPFVRGPSALAWAIRSLVADAARPIASSDPPAGRTIVIDADGPWDEVRAKNLLGDLGIRTPERRDVGTPAGAARALVDLGAPVAVKLVDAEVLHKTEVDGVHLGVRTDEEMATAITALQRGGARRFLVERMAEPGVDLVVSVRRDPVFGPIAMIGLGGTAAEAIADVAIRTIPLDESVVQSMTAELRASALLHGWRGGPSVDLTEMTTLLGALGAVLAGTPAVEEIELNPLRITRDGLIAIDAVVITNKEDEDV